MEGSTRIINVLIRRRQLVRLSNKKGYDEEGQVCDKELPSASGQQPSVQAMEFEWREVGQSVTRERERELCVGTRFSNLYTAVDTPAESA